jgi:ABC-type oligopeptide transport system substrate-binding subunit
VRPVVAADVVYGIHRACRRATGTPDAFVLYLIEGCEQVHASTELDASNQETIAARALDDVTLEIGLRQPASQFLAITSMWLMRPVPRELVEEAEADWQMNSNLITNGPFLLAPGSLAKNRPALYRNPLWPLPRRGNVDRVNIVILNDELQAFQLWQAKRLDISPLPAAEREAFLNELPERAKLVTNQTVFYLGFNFNSGVLREANVRRALNAAIDRELLVEELYNGRAMAMRHIIPPGVLGGPPVNEIGKGYDPDYARQQMATSGFRSCRLMPAITYLVSTSDLSLQQAELIRQMWIDELGCTEEQIVIEQVQFGTLLANTRQDAAAERPDIWELGWASYFPDAHNWVGDLLHCTESENRQGRPCSEVDELIDQADRELDQDQRQLTYRRIEDLFFGAEGIEPVAPLYVPGEYALLQSWLTYEPALFGGEQYDSYTIAADLKRLEQSRSP